MMLKRSVRLKQSECHACAPVPKPDIQLGSLGFRVRGHEPNVQAAGPFQPRTQGPLYLRA